MHILYIVLRSLTFRSWVLTHFCQPRASLTTIECAYDTLAIAKFSLELLAEQ